MLNICIKTVIQEMTVFFYKSRQFYRQILSAYSKIIYELSFSTSVFEGVVWLNLKILIADGNTVFAEKLKQFLAVRFATKLITIVFDGYKAVDEIIKNDFDLAIVAMFLPGLDGLGVLGSVKELSISNLPAFFILSSTGYSKIIKAAFDLGAEYYMVRPIDFEQLAQRIEQFMPQEMNEYGNNDKIEATASETTDSRIKNILDDMGFQPNLLGYKYLLIAINMLNKDISLINSVTKNLYRELADKCNSTPQRVERAIRNAIELAWSKGNMDQIYKVFDPEKFTQKTRPSNSEFMITIVGECYKSSKNKNSEAF